MTSYKIGQAFEIDAIWLIYAGIVCGDKTEPDCHLFVHPEQKNNINWNDALQWADGLGCSLPARKEQAILFGNVPELFESRCYWSGAQCAADDSYAWTQRFGYGFQDLTRKSDECRARAVRRLPISEV